MPSHNHQFHTITFPLPRFQQMTKYLQFTSDVVEVDDKSTLYKEYIRFEITFERISILLLGWFLIIFSQLSNVAFTLPTHTFKISNAGDV